MWKRPFCWTKSFARIVLIGFIVINYIGNRYEPVPDRSGKKPIYVCVMCMILCSGFSLTTRSTADFGNNNNYIRYRGSIVRRPLSPKAGPRRRRRRRRQNQWQTPSSRLSPNTQTMRHRTGFLRLSLYPASRLDSASRLYLTATVVSELPSHPWYNANVLVNHVSRTCTMRGSIGEKYTSSSRFFLPQYMYNYIYTLVAYRFCTPNNNNKSQCNTVVLRALYNISGNCRINVIFVYRVYCGAMSLKITL